MFDELCDSAGTGTKKDAAKRDVTCRHGLRFKRALAEAGSRLTHLRPGERWEPLEGEALRRHPDPMGALQRGEVPALMVRGLIPQAELTRMLDRMAAFAQRLHENGTTVFNQARMVPRKGMLCPMVKHLAYDCRGEPECAAARNVSLQRHCVRLQKGDRSAAGASADSRLGRYRGSSSEFGNKMYNNLQRGTQLAVMKASRGMDVLYEHLSRGCSGPWCGPKEAIMHGVRQLAGRRGVKLGSEEMTRRHKLNLSHSVGTLRAMERGWPLRRGAKERPHAAASARPPRLWRHEATAQHPTPPHPTPPHPTHHA